jgi:hypothetical protein
MYRQPDYNACSLFYLLTPCQKDKAVSNEDNTDGHRGSDIPDGQILKINKVRDFTDADAVDRLLIVPSSKAI